MLYRLLFVLVAAAAILPATATAKALDTTSTARDPWAILGGLVTGDLTVAELNGKSGQAIEAQFPVSEFSPFGGAATYDYPAIDVAGGVFVNPFDLPDGFGGQTFGIPCGPQTLTGLRGGDVPINIICPADGATPANSVEWWMLAVDVQGPLPVTDCADTKIETGAAINDPAMGKPYAASSLAPGDLFHTTHLAHVLRCDDGEWASMVQTVFNPQTGMFDESDSAAGGVVWPGGVLLFIPINDTAQSTTPFTFATDANNPSTPETVRASRLGGERGGLISLDERRAAGFPAQIVTSQTRDLPAEPSAVTAEKGDSEPPKTPAEEDDNGIDETMFYFGVTSLAAAALLLGGYVLARKRRKLRSDQTPYDVWERVKPGEQLAGDEHIIPAEDIGKVADEDPYGTRDPDDKAPAQPSQPAPRPNQPGPDPDHSVLDEIDESGAPPGLS